MSVGTRGSIGLGTTLTYSLDDGTTFTPVPRLSEIGDMPLVGEADDVDITGYDTPGRTREYIKGLVESGELECTGIWTADPDQAALQDINDNVPWKMTLPDGSAELAFDGYVRVMNITPQLDDRMEFSFTIRVSGEPVLTIPAPAGV